MPDSADFSNGLSADVIAYYDALASCYDEDRFGNSYGAFIHAQECRWLRRVLPVGGQVLDLGCGTGRMLDLTTHGVDGSEAMLAQARARHPGKVLARGDVTAVPWGDETFDAIFCLHVLMHLPPVVAQAAFAEAWRLLRPGRLLAFDAPSAARRRLLGYRTSGWHGATAYSRAGLRAMLPGWTPVGDRGVLFLPHRLPAGLRPACLGLDTALCASPLRSLASYRLWTFGKPNR
ncbi:MAG: hypothetical protein OHK0039_40690 [Bacteroidia bacterium]